MTVVVLFFAGVFVYAKVINDAPDRLGTLDLGDALNAPPTNSAGPDGAPGTSVESANFDGDWTPTADSEFGYRVDEVITGVSTTAVGRSNDIDGELTIEGTSATAVDITVQVDDSRSDKGARDVRFRGPIMNSEEFPTATFTLTQPIEFGSIPTGAATVTASATGELTLRGVTNSVTFDVTAQTVDGRIGVLGSIPVVFADYRIDNPSFGPIKAEDHGLVEFLLVFDRA